MQHNTYIIKYIPVLKYNVVAALLRVNNFATVSNRKACDISKAVKFCIEKSIKLA